MPTMLLLHTGTLQEKATGVDRGKESLKEFAFRGLHLPDFSLVFKPCL